MYSLPLSEDVAGSVPSELSPAPIRNPGYAPLVSWSPQPSWKLPSIRLPIAPLLRNANSGRPVGSNLLDVGVLCLGEVLSRSNGTAPSEKLADVVRRMFKDVADQPHA